MSVQQIVLTQRKLKYLNQSKSTLIYFISYATGKTGQKHLIRILHDLIKITAAVGV